MDGEEEEMKVESGLFRQGPLSQRSVVECLVIEQALLQTGVRASCLLEKTEDLKKQDTREETVNSFAFSKHGAGRSMDGLEQDAPATEGLVHLLLKTWNMMFQGWTGTSIPSHMKKRRVEISPLA